MKPLYILGKRRRLSRVEPRKKYAKVNPSSHEKSASKILLLNIEIKPTGRHLDAMKLKLLIRN